MNRNLKELDCRSWGSRGFWETEQGNRKMEIFREVMAWVGNVHERD